MVDTRGVKGGMMAEERFLATTEIRVDPYKVCAYIRWSTDDQENGTTLEEQLEATKYFCKAQGWHLSDDMIFIDDGYSGENLRRPAVAKVRELVQAGQLNAVVVMRLDRLSRNLVDLVNLVLNEWSGKCHVRSVREPFDTSTEMGRIVFTFLAQMAEGERIRIVARTFGGRIRRAKAGRMVGQKLSYGLRYGVHEGLPAGTVLVDSARMEHVKYVFERLRQVGGDTLAAELNRGHTGGIRWTKSMVLRIARNPVYLGYQHWGHYVQRMGRTLQDLPELPKLLIGLERTPMEPIVSQELFDEVQRILAARAEGLKGERDPAFWALANSGRALASGYLLTGIARCPCGSTIQGAIRNGIAYYDCAARNHVTGRERCSSGSVPQKIADAEVLSLIRRRIARPARKKGRNQAETIWQERLDIARRTLSEMKRELDECERKLKKINADYLAEEISAADRRELRTEVEAEQTAVQQRMRDAQDRLRLIEAELDKKSAVETHAQDVLRWDELDMPAKKTVLRNMLAKLTIFRAKGGRSGPNNNPVEITLDLA